MFTCSGHRDDSRREVMAETVKREPMALATGTGSVIDQRQRPEASAFGSGSPEVSPSQVKPPAATFWEVKAPAATNFLAWLRSITRLLLVCCLIVWTDSPAKGSPFGIPNGSAHPTDDTSGETLEVSSGQSLHQLLANLQTRMVKIYGAGGMQGLDGFQSGFVVSPDGLILTSWSTALDIDEVRVLSWDGKRWDATIAGIDPQRQLALLKVPTDTLPYFKVSDTPNYSEGDRVFGISNLFNIATGDEPLSVQQGVIMAIAPLEAQRGSFKTPYRDTAIIVDVMTNNPGASGGALVNLHGELVGVLGKELSDSETGIWLNYAIPVDVLALSISDMQSGKTKPMVDDELVRAERPHTLSDLGIQLVPDVVEKTPAYVDGVADDSAADGCGLLPNDLILVVNDRRIDSCKSLRKFIESIDRADALTFLVERENELFTLEIRP